MRLKCRYRIDDPVRFKSNVSDVEETVRSVVCAEAIQAAAVSTADGLMLGEQTPFRLAVRAGARDRLEQMRSGIVVEDIIIESATWPIGALGAYQAAQQAAQTRRQLEDAARADAIRALRAAAGESYPRLVGKFWDAPGGERPASTKPGEQQDLIGKYNAALETGDPDRAARLRKQIDDVLTSPKTSGAAAAIIARATADADAIEQRVKSLADEFRKVLPGFRKDPKFMLERRWAEVYEEIMKAPEVAKTILPEGKGKRILQIGRDPDIEREVLRARIKKKPE
jgi:regulator of protease activity HflC (stomatin/prohibitin superfamily)